MIKAYLSRSSNIELNPETSDFTEDDLESLTAENPTLYFRLPGRVIDHIVKLPSKSDKITALDFISGEMMEVGLTTKDAPTYNL